ncbi:hypothetical protein [Streptomyces longisporoflavus]|uniref:Uncharacterized protein n=1 Tax=Streptomyces longisporoflavus TaxID=28044 RepID=A0ABW7R1R9_9ACTN
MVFQGDFDHEPGSAVYNALTGLVRVRDSFGFRPLDKAHVSSKDVRDLARNIEKAQASEIATMTTGLKSWVEKIPREMNKMLEGS